MVGITGSETYFTVSSCGFAYDVLNKILFDNSHHLFGSHTQSYVYVHVMTDVLLSTNPAGNDILNVIGIT